MCPQIIKEPKVGNFIKLATMKMDMQILFDIQ